VSSEVNDPINVEWIHNHKSTQGNQAFHYNLGTNYLKTEKFALAKYHFLRADALGYRDEKLENNVAYLNDKLKQSDFHSVSTAGDIILGEMVHLRPSMGVSLTLFILLILLIRRVFSGKKMRLISIVLSTFPSIILYFLTWKYSWIIALSPIDIVSGPSQLFTRRLTVTSGEILMVSRPTNALKVHYPSWADGWIIGGHYLTMNKE
jgi:hypothetical protein